jgi:hypothetical protein
MKDEGANLNMMTLTQKFVMNCELVGFEESFQGTCFGHAFSKACQYETIIFFFSKTLNMFALNLPNLIYKNV